MVSHTILYQTIQLNLKLISNQVYSVCKEDALREFKNHAYVFIKLMYCLIKLSAGYIRYVNT